MLALGKRRQNLVIIGGELFITAFGVSVEFRAQAQQRGARARVAANRRGDQRLNACALLADGDLTAGVLQRDRLRELFQQLGTEVARALRPSAGIPEWPGLN